MATSENSMVRYTAPMRALFAGVFVAVCLTASPRIIIKLDPSTGTNPRDGRLILIVSKDFNGEPRHHVTWGLQTQQIFGKNVDGWKPGETVELAADNGESFTAGELLFKVHNAFVAHLRQMDHQYFEGFSLDEHQEAGKPPLYNLDLGS